METSVDFESNLFNPFLPEEDQVNPGVFGAELAWWLARQLAQRGVATSYPQNEDWGWFIEYLTGDGHEFWLCCANLDGAADRWRCYLEPKPKGLFGRGKAPLDAALPLMRALREVLEAEAGIRNLAWE
jgi:hypothetical protein